MADSEVAPTALQSAFLRLPTQIRLKIYCFVFHRPALELALCQVGRFSDEGYHLSEGILTILHEKTLVSILLSCHQCNDEANQLLYETIALATNCGPVVLPFLAYNLGSKRDFVKDISFMLTTYRGPVPSMKWIAVLPNIETVEIRCCELHSLELEPKTFGDYSREEKLHRGRMWLNTFDGFLEECEAPGSVKVYVRITSLYEHKEELYDRRVPFPLDLYR